MVRTIQIGDVGVEMLSNAATPYRYKQCYGEDLILKMAKGVDEAEAVDIFLKLGYIMAAQAAHEDLARLTPDGFMTWLEQFEYMDYVESADSIADLYIASKKGTSVPKA